MLFASSLTKNPERMNLSDRSEFQAAAGPRFAVGRYEMDQLTQQAGQSFGHPVLDEKGNLRRVLFASLKPELLRSAAARIPLVASATVTVLDRTGTVVVHLPGTNGWADRSVPENHLLRQLPQRSIRAT